MNVVQSYIDRQLGVYCRYNYDNILKRLVVKEEESFYGLQGSAVPSDADHDPPIFACRFSEASGYEHILALANEDGRVAIQDTRGARAAARLEGFQCHNNAVFDLAWMPHHMSFVTVSGDHTAVLWDVGASSPKRLLVFSQHTKSVKTAAFRPDAPAVFATGARDGHVLVWDARAPPARPALVVKPDSWLAGCHSRAPGTPGAHGKRPRHAQRAVSITGLVFQDDTTLISCGECDGNVKVWDLRKSYHLHTREPLPRRAIPHRGGSARNGYTNLVMDRARTRLYASCMDNVIYCFNVAAYNALPEQMYIGHENGTFYIKTSLSPDGMYLVSGSSDKNAYIWDVKCPEPVVRLTGHWAEVTCAAWCQRGDAKIVTCSDDARHKIWRIGTEAQVETKGHAEAVPRTDAALPKWSGLDRTPTSLKRNATTPGSAKRVRESSGRKTKRCLVDLMNASKELEEVEAKRLRLDLQPIPEEGRLLPAGVKRHRSPEETTPKKQCCREGESEPDWTYASQPGTSLGLVTPTKTGTSLGLLTPTKTPATSPAKTPSPPTKNLPNFVLDGQAPHLRLMSPVKRKRDTTDWLTLMGREKRGRGEGASEGSGAAGGPREAPPRRVSVSDKTPKAKSKPLLKYFTVASKNK